jgi:hypothetical protein
MAHQAACATENISLAHQGMVRHILLKLKKCGQI